jgi:maltose alpha-D-glucosyltransferase/alpha-amylase
MSTYFDLSATLGRRTAEMHLALAADSTDPRFAPEPLGKEDLGVAVQRALAHAERTLGGLEAAIGTTPLRMPSDAALLGRTILDARSNILERIRSAAALDTTATRIRIHGDYRLGQVLLAEGDIYIQNVEGHLSWPAAAQREKQSALRDVAGLLRSFSYAAHAALLTRGTGSLDQLAHLARWAQAWETWASVSFLRSYCATAGSSPVLPRDTRERDALLRFFMIDRSLRELDGELNNRPEWVGVPLSGLLGLLGLR